MSKSLKTRIARIIETSGPMALPEYMHVCLMDPAQGYYTNQPVIGGKGDFVTAPEVSQMFGELLGIWAIRTWEALGKPDPFSLVELGPGKGTMMRDILRATAINHDFSNAADIFLVESSDRLKQVQQKCLEKHGGARWMQSLDELPNMPAIILANEFLDVLPFSQYARVRDKWHERMIGIGEDGSLQWTVGMGLLDPDSLPEGGEKEPEGSIVEISTAREAVIQQVCEPLDQHGGAALFIDYGHAESGFGDTFQAMKAHEYVDPLAEPGQADLTSHVDFGALRKIAGHQGLHVFPLLTQGEFLLKLGLLERAGALGHAQDESIQQRLKSEAERLALPGEMGGLFKVFAISTASNLWPFNHST